MAARPCTGMLLALPSNMSQYWKKRAIEKRSSLSCFAVYKEGQMILDNRGLYYKTILTQICA
jgi:hypothetical protein